MGILVLLVVLGCVTVWGIGLGKRLAGWPKLSLRAGAVTVAIGALTIIAAVVLPRLTFGELGHGDGMGLIGLISIAAVATAAGFMLMLVTTIIYFLGQSRRTKLSKEKE